MRLKEYAAATSIDGNGSRWHEISPGISKPQEEGMERSKFMVLS